MSALSNEEASLLFEAAMVASVNAYAPFSRFPVGAAAMSANGRVFSGNNVENASYGLTVCAERVAISNMVASGENDLKAVAVYCGSVSAAPCGACRQFIIEFGKNAVVIFKQGDELVQKTIGELLPYAFTKSALG